MEREQIEFYLRNPDADERIWEEIHFVENELEKYDKERERLQESTIYSNQVKPKPLNAVKVQTSNKNDLGDVLIKAIEFINNSENEYNAKLVTLYKQLDDIKRLKFILGILDQGSLKLIRLYYRENLTYRALENELNISSPVLCKKIKNIINDIITCFNSSYSDEQLAKMDFSSSLKFLQPKDTSNAQMEFDNFLESDDIKK